MSRTRGGSVAACEPGSCGFVPNTIDLPFPDHVPLRSGIASCARADVAAAPTSANAKTRPLIASSRADAIAHGIGWLPFLDTYRTMCRAPEPAFRRVLEGIR